MPPPGPLIVRRRRWCPRHRGGAAIVDTSFGALTDSVSPASVTVSTYGSSMAISHRDCPCRVSGRNRSASPLVRRVVLLAAVAVPATVVGHHDRRRSGVLALLSVTVNSASSSPSTTDRHRPMRHRPPPVSVVVLDRAHVAVDVPQDARPGRQGRAGDRHREGLVVLDVFESSSTSSPSSVPVGAPRLESLSVPDDTAAKSVPDAWPGSVPVRRRIQPSTVTSDPARRCSASP